MSELVPLLCDLVSEVEAGRPAALCVVVKTRGSTPQSAGAAMLVRSDFKTVGTLGGGCVEAEVKRRAFELLGQRQSALLDYLLNHDYGWDDGLICGGRMYVGVMPVAEGFDLDPIRQAIASASARQPATLPIVIEHDGKHLEYRMALDVPPTLLIAGAGHVGQALARLAAPLNFHVVVIDERGDYASPDRFDPGVTLIVDDIARALRNYPLDPACYVVIVTRGHQHDQQALDAVIRSQAGYIGMIGSTRKRDMIYRDLEAAGVARERLERVRSPIGLPIDAVTVPEIAVSIAAELVQVRRAASSAPVLGPFERPAATSVSA